MKIQSPGAAILAATMTLAGPAAAIGQNQQPVAQAQQLFEAGQYEQALKSLGEMRDKGAAGLPEAFLAAHVALRQNQNDRAKEEFARLTAADDPVWRLVGESSTAAVDNDRDRSLELALKAVEEAKAAPATIRPGGSATSTRTISSASPGRGKRSGRQQPKSSSAPPS